MRDLWIQFALLCACCSSANAFLVPSKTAISWKLATVGGKSLEVATVSTTEAKEAAVEPAEKKADDPAGKSLEVATVSKTETQEAAAKPAEKQADDSSEQSKKPIALFKRKPIKDAVKDYDDVKNFVNNRKPLVRDEANKANDTGSDIWSKARMKRVQELYFGGKDSPSPFSKRIRPQSGDGFWTQRSIRNVDQDGNPKRIAPSMSTAAATPKSVESSKTTSPIQPVSVSPHQSAAFLKRDIQTVSDDTPKEQSVEQTTAAAPIAPTTDEKEVATPSVADTKPVELTATETVEKTEETPVQQLELEKSNDSEATTEEPVAVVEDTKAEKDVVSTTALENSEKEDSPVATVATLDNIVEEKEDSKQSLQVEDTVTETKEESEDSKEAEPESAILDVVEVATKEQEDTTSVDVAVVENSATDAKEDDTAQVTTTKESSKKKKKNKKKATLKAKK